MAARSCATSNVIAPMPCATTYSPAHRSRTTLDEASAGPVSGVLQDLAADDEVIVRIDPGKIILAALLSLEFTIPLITLVAYFVVTAVTPLPMWSGVVAIIPMIMGLFGFVSKRVITQFNYTLAPNAQRPSHHARAHEPGEPVGAG